MPAELRARFDGFPVPVWAVLQLQERTQVQEDGLPKRFKGVSWNKRSGKWRAQIWNPFLSTVGQHYLVSASALFCALNCRQIWLNQLANEAHPVGGFLRGFVSS